MAGLRVPLSAMGTRSINNPAINIQVSRLHPLSEYGDIYRYVFRESYRQLIIVTCEHLLSFSGFRVRSRDALWVL